MVNNCRLFHGLCSKHLVFLFVVWALQGGRAAESPNAYRVPFPDHNSYPHLLLKWNHTPGRLILFLPDTASGYYRGSRFDWSGMLGDVSVNSRRFFSEWRTPHDPTKPGHGCAVAEEFGMRKPVGYSDISPGEVFLKIGVGALVKPDKPDEYFFNHPYTIIDHGTWQTTIHPGVIEITHELSIPSGYGYHYRKKLVLAQDSTMVTVLRELRNTGSHTIVTDHYSHNFFLIDGRPVGNGYSVTFPFRVVLPEKRRDILAEALFIRDSTLAVIKTVANGSLWTPFQGIEQVAKHNGFQVTDSVTGAAVGVSGSHPLDFFEFYAERSALCPEPFITLTVKPGKTVSWSTRYSFSAGE